MKPPQLLDDEVFVEIEKILDLDQPNDRLRERLSSCVFDYIWARQHPWAREAAISKRLKEIKLAAKKLTPTIKDRNKRIVERSVRSVILRQTDVNLDDLSKKLERIASFIDTRGKHKGGRPKDKAWNELMLNLVGIYEEASGKPATAWRDKHHPERGYQTQFVRVAAIVDKATADIGRVNPLNNIKLGSTLEEILKRRSGSSRGNS